MAWLVFIAAPNSGFTAIDFNIHRQGLNRAAVHGVEERHPLCTFKPKYVGPFPILRMVGDNACELELPEAMKIHPVVNVSQVKKYHGSLQRPPPIEIDGEEEYEVEDILDHRRSGRGYQYLVSWTGYDASENQWLPEREL